MSESSRAGLFRGLARAAAAATLALIALGGIVRITGSGMGCGDDWPLCNGRLIPPLDGPTLIEYAHRLSAAFVGGLVLALLATAWTRHRRDARLRDPATLSAVLLVVQVLLGAVTVRLELPAWSVVLHLATAMALLAALVVAALRATRGPARPTDSPLGGSPSGGSIFVQVQTAESAGLPSVASRFPGPSSATWRGPDDRRRYARLARLTAAMGFATVVAGGLVANLNAGPACHGFPLCNGSLLPAGGTPMLVHWTHRLLAFALVGFLGVSWLRAHRPCFVRDGLRRLSTLALGVALLQVGVAAAMVLSFLPPALRASHMTLGALLWAILVALDQRAHDTARLAAVAAAGELEPTPVARTPGPQPRPPFRRSLRPGEAP